MSENLDDLNRGAPPTFSVVRPDATDLEWAFRRFRLSVDIGLGPTPEYKVGLMAYLGVFSETVSVLCLELTPDQFNRALWLAKSESEDAAFNYLRASHPDVQ